MNHWPSHCARCGADLTKVSSIMSKFNQDTICADVCKTRERANPNYKAADEAEIAAVRAGILNFVGVGAPPELYKPACLAEQVAIALAAGTQPVLSGEIARNHGGELISAPDLDTDQYRFPDQSVLAVGRSSSARCTVLAYSKL